MKDAARLGGLISSIAEETFYTELLEVVCDRIGSDSAAVIVYKRDCKPLLLEDALAEGERDSFEKNYSAGVYLVSPFYTAWRKGQQPELTRFDDIAPDNYTETFHYGSHSGRAGQGRDAAFLVRISDDTAYLVFASRVADSNGFTDAEIEAFRQEEPILRAAIVRHHSLVSRDGNELDVDRLPIVQKHVEEAFNRFGASMLTRREREIVRLILEGHSSKSAARILSISPRTESVHRKNIYNKLKVSSQSELFALFFQALTHEASAESGDPVAALLER